MAERIGLFGGTFDPVHLGHVAVARSFLDSGLIDQLWILPAPSPPHKEGRSVTEFKHRKKMLELAFRGWEGVLVSDLETKLPAPSYTIQTIRHLKQDNPGKEFFLCIGEDSLAEFFSWHKPGEILQECELLVAERPNAPSEDIQPELRDKAHFVSHRPVEISSTDLRRRLAEGETVRDLLPEPVLDYIRAKQLYSMNS